MQHHVTYFKLPKNASELANLESRSKCTQNEIDAILSDPDGLMKDHSVDAIKMYLGMSWLGNKLN